MKKLVISTLFSLFTLIGIAQQTGTLSGKITDGDTKDVLIGATIQLVGTYTGASCDIDGNYAIKEIKPGDYSVKISFIGYSDKIFNGIEIEANKTTNLRKENN